MSVILCVDDMEQVDPVGVDAPLALILLDTLSSQLPPVADQARSNQAFHSTRRTLSDSEEDDLARLGCLIFLLSITNFSDAVTSPQLQD
ncbi:hypothetical protein EYZ11_002834 [Aspergillus tanneri]|uniref:Uncharacterized protein n=1 Tax=Aspergillus tanneri TaxID=1220188 RepID=A0A4S3JTY9_9EURO|nr:uncharacterized protein ATNIH1004_008477 [Aspergillus tanneri]KAA8644278.1 hypothetical protein ATNIH1004_008477 [Aspergillus tanneri]THC97671.1 hypothetical protein EYZ11_002834 [Aspergillus tanneri]